MIAAMLKIVQGVLALVGLMLIIAVVVGVAGTSTSHRAVATSTTLQEPAIGVSSDALFEAYQHNEVAADKLYRGHALRVTGAVQTIRKDISDQPYVVLWTTNEFIGVQAHFVDDDILASLHPGQTHRTALRG